MSESEPIVDDSGEQAFSDGYTKAYKGLLEQGWNPRKARRYLDSIAKRNLKKYIKGIKKNVKL
jgi:hypothetical protein